MSGAIYSFNRPNDRFTIVANSLIEDVELKHAAFRIVVYVGRHAATFRLSQHAIGRALGMDRGTVARHLVHLEELGYLRRVRNYSQDGRQADDLYVSQERLTAEQWDEAVQSPCGKSPHCESPHGKTQQRKKTNSKKTNLEEDQPSGGSSAGAPPAPAEEEAEMPKTIDSGQESLFPDVVKPKKPKKAPKIPEGAAAVVAAFVESYTNSHGGQRPLSSDIGRVARAAKLILAKGEASLEDLVLCAKKMGQGQFANLYQELKFMRPAIGKAEARYATGSNPAWADVQTSVQGDALTPEEWAELFGAPE